MRRGPGSGNGAASWKLDASGQLSAAAFVPSPNCDDRPPGAEIELLVIHNISLPPGEFGGPGIVEFFTNCLDPEGHPYYREIHGQKVSSHFLIRRDGELFQFVPCGQRAWHAGQSEWRGRSRCNDFSVGVELEGADDQPFTDSQYAVLAELTRVLRREYPIKDWVGHSDIATPPGRKTDPGQQFDWERFRALLESGDR